MKNIEILHEDDFSIIVNKPAGLAVQGGKGVKSSLDKILAEIRVPPPLLVHRLDKDTSGVLLAAKTREAAAGFSRLIGTDDSNKAERKAVKQYVAVCAGSPDKKTGSITQDLLIRNSIKKSETKYKVIGSGQILLSDNTKQEYSILELELGTGRMHQIRRHLAVTGNPVLGDDKYGDFSLNKKLHKAIRLKHLLLHACRLVIIQYDIDVSAPLPEYFNHFQVH